MSAGAKVLKFQQTTPSSTWTINHGFGVKPFCDISVNVGGSSVKIIPLGVTHQNDNTVVVTFTNVQTGTAVLIG